MYCPKCRTEFRKGFKTCSDCGVPLVAELPPEPPPPPAPEYVKFVNLYSPKNETELSLIKSILDSEEISYFVRNDNFGSLEVGPHIGLYNGKMIQVQDDQYEKAKELLSDYLEKTNVPIENTLKNYSLFDKIRMVIEFFVFGWVMPGKIKHKATHEEDRNTD
jgi:hypothetical protein